MCKVQLACDCMENPVTTTVKTLKQQSRLNGYPPHPVEATAHDRFPYGWRTVAEVQPDGSTRYFDIPLTQADFLDPQVGDHLVQSDQHIKFVISLVNRFSKRYINESDVGIFSDLKMLWGIPGEKEPAPDLAIVPNLKVQQRYRPSFDMVAEGTRPCLIVEVISPQYPGDDTTKVGIYQRAGVAEYFIINPHFEDEDKPMELIGYRLKEGEYQRINPDGQGRLLSQTTNVWFELDKPRRDLILTNAITGQRLLKAEEEYEARLAAEAEVARLRALLVNQR